MPPFFGKDEVHDRPTADWCRKRGLKYLEEEEPAKAIDCFQKLAELQPGVDAYRLLGGAYLFCDQPAPAAQWLQMATSLAPADDDLAGDFGMAKARMGKPDEAKPYLERAWAADPKNEEVAVALARIFMSTQDFTKAVSILVQVLDSAPIDEQTPLLMLSDCYIAQDQLAQAEECLIRAIRLAPENAQAHCALASLHMLAGRDDVAFKELTTLLSAFPDSPEINFTMGNLWMLRRKFAVARPSFERTINANPQHVPAYVALASVNLAEGNLDQAASLVTKALALDDKQFDALRIAAVVAEAQKDYPRALRFAQAALKVMDQDFQANLIAARASLSVQAPKALTNVYLTAADKLAATPEQRDKVRRLQNHA